MIALIGLKIEEGAATQTQVTVAHDLEKNKQFKFFAKGLLRASRPGTEIQPVGMDNSTLERLWRESEKIVQEYL